MPEDRHEFDQSNPRELESEILNLHYRIQKDKEISHEAIRPYDQVEVMPSFYGGQKALMEYIATHIKYPPIAEENGIQGKVIVKFVIDAEGYVKNVKIAKGVDPSLDKEAARVIGNMPKGFREKKKENM